MYNRENTRRKNDEKPTFAETGANPLTKNEFLAFLHLVFPRLYQKEKKKIYAHHYNRCKIRQEIQIRARNYATMQMRAGKCRKLSKNHKIACRKKRCGKIPSAPITI